MSLARQRLCEFAVIAAIVGGFSLLIWRAIPDCSGPTGRASPTEPPDEVRRLRHPAGFSIVVPPDWEPWPAAMPLRQDDPTLHLFPKSPTGPNCPARRREAGLTVMDSGSVQPPDLDEFDKIRFQDQPAYERMEVVRQWTFDDPALSEYTLYLRRGGRWFLITYFIAESRTTLPPMVRDYISTIRWE